MDRTPRWTFAVAVGLLLAVPPSAPAGGPPPPTLGVRKVDRSVASDEYKGVVQAIDDDAMTVYVPRNGRGKAEVRKIAPIDVLRKGEVLPEIFGSRAYRWADVKVGDAVEVATLKDDGDGVTYCLTICIHRRPGADLPKSQKPEIDRRYAAERVLNALDNGEDVSDEEGLRAFPPCVDYKGKRYQGGLQGELLERRNANRGHIALEKERKERAKYYEANPPGGKPTPPKPNDKK